VYFRRQQSDLDPIKSIILFRSRGDRQGSDITSSR